MDTSGSYLHHCHDTECGNQLKVQIISPMVKADRCNQDIVLLWYYFSHKPLRGIFHTELSYFCFPFGIHVHITFANCPLKTERSLRINTFITVRFQSCLSHFLGGGVRMWPLLTCSPGARPHPIPNPTPDLFRLVRLDSPQPRPPCVGPTHCPHGDPQLLPPPSRDHQAWPCPLYKYKIFHLELTQEDPNTGESAAKRVVDVWLKGFFVSVLCLSSKLINFH